MLPCHVQDDAKEIKKAVEVIRSVEWKDIRAEKFPLTPIVLFENYASTVESLISRHAAELRRRQESLAPADQGEDEEEGEAENTNVGTFASNADKYGVVLFEDGIFRETLSRLRSIA